MNMAFTWLEGVLHQSWGANIPKPWELKSSGLWWRCIKRAGSWASLWAAGKSNQPEAFRENAWSPLRATDGGAEGGERAARGRLGLLTQASSTSFLFSLYFCIGFWGRPEIWDRPEKRAEWKEKKSRKLKKKKTKNKNCVYVEGEWIWMIQNLTTRETKYNLYIHGHARLNNHVLGGPDV